MPRITGLISLELIHLGEFTPPHMMTNRGKSKLIPSAIRSSALSLKMPYGAPVSLSSPISYVHFPPGMPISRPLLPESTGGGLCGLNVGGPVDPPLTALGLSNKPDGIGGLISTDATSSTTEIDPC